jgi:hypothetical protein
MLPSVFLTFGLSAGKGKNKLSKDELSFIDRLLLRLLSFATHFKEKNTGHSQAVPYL